MLSDAIAWILSTEGCLDPAEVSAILSPPSTGHTVMRDAVLAALESLPVFERCSMRSAAWTLTGQCPHPNPNVPGDTELGLAQLPSMFTWQAEALEAWLAVGSRGLIEAVTGAGKSLVAMHAIERAVSRGGLALVVVPTLELQSQWLRQLTSAFARRHIVEAYRDRTRRIYSEPQIVVAVMNSARDINFAVRGHGDLLVVDEVHRCATPANVRILDDRFDYRLGLSATIARPDAGHHRYLDPYFGPVVYRYSHDMAVRDSVIAPFCLCLLPVQMHDYERMTYDDLSRLISVLLRAFVARYGRPLSGNDFVATLIRACAGAYSATSPGIEEVALRLQQALFQRRALLDGLASKLEALAELAPEIHDARRCLIFSQSIASAEASARVLLQQGVSAAAIHSGMAKVLRRQQLERLERGELEALAAPRLLDEGIDVPAVGLAIIATASGSKRQLIQRLGRILRRKPDGGVAKLVILYASGTVEDPDQGAHSDLLSRLITVADSFEIIPMTRASFSSFDANHG